MCIEKDMGKEGYILKVVILCGGRGTRMKELTDDIPKPLALVGGKAILWHVMKIYNYYGFNDFILLLGYKGDKIKEYFVNYDWKNSDFILDNSQGNIKLFSKSENWRILFLDTGEDTMTGGRIRRAKQYIDSEVFMLTYADGLADINLPKLIKFHENMGAIATVTGVKKKNQYGVLDVKDGIARSFKEKPQSNDIINGGFFVMNKGVFDYIDKDDSCVFEKEPMMNLARDGQLSVYQHEGFWTAMDTFKDIMNVNEMWDQHKALWKVW